MADPAINPFSSQRQFLVSLIGFPGYWARKTGGKTSGSATDVYDGGEMDPEKLGGTRTTDNVVLSRGYKVARDQAIIDQLTPLVNSYRGTISIQPTDADLIPVGKANVHADSLLVGVTPPDVDAASTDPGNIELEFAVSKPV